MKETIPKSSVKQNSIANHTVDTVRTTWGLPEFEQECMQEMERNGLGLPPGHELNSDGYCHRYSCDTKKNQPDEYYYAHKIIHTDDEDYTQYQLIVAYGSWSTRVKHTYYSWKNDSSFSQESLKRLNQERKQKLAQAEEDIQRKREDEAKEAAQKWSEASFTPPSDNYARCTSYKTKKCIESIGVKYGLNPSNYTSIIIPFKNNTGEIRGLEYLSFGKNGKKYPRYFGSKEGFYHVVADKKINNGDTIFVAEGWATGVSIYMANQGIVCTVGGKENIDNVVGNLRSSYPASHITIAIDIDDAGKNRKDAESVARKYDNIKLVAPAFPPHKSFDTEKNKPYTDFNDLHQVCGIDEVRRQLFNTTTVKTTAEHLKELADQRLKKEDSLASFSLDNLPEIPCNYIRSQCQKSNIVHPLTVTMVMLTEVSAYLGNKVFTDYFGRTYANLWVIVIAESGSGKSTALKLGARNSRVNQKRVFREIKSIEEEIKQEADPDKKRELEKKMQELSLENVILPEKSTTEAMLLHASKGHNGVMYFHEISSFLQNFNKTHNGDLKSTFTALYDGGDPVEINTIARGRTIIEDAAISMIGMTTLDWFIPEIQTADIKSGFLPRFAMFALPQQDNDPGLWPPISTLEDTDEMTSYDELITNIKARVISSGNEGIYLQLSPEARDALSNDITKKGIYWDLLKIRDQYEETKAYETIKIFIPRWLSDVVKLAMILELLSKPQSESITAESIVSSYSIVLAAIKSTISLLKNQLGEPRMERECRLLLEWFYMRIKKEKTTKRQDIQGSKSLPEGNYGDILKELILRNKIEEDKSAQHMKDWNYTLVK